MNKVALDKLVGNEDVKKQIKVAAAAAHLNNRAMPHMLLTGNAGCGKTSVARATADMLGVPFMAVSPDTFKTPETAANLFHDLPANGYNKEGQVIDRILPAILFIDEAHNLTPKAQEILGLAMENLTHTFTQGRGRRKESVTIWLPQFTVFGATTDPGKLLKMLRDRFKIQFIFSTYSLSEAKKIVSVHAEKLKISITDEAIEDIAKRCRGTPRIALSYLERVKDNADVIQQETIDKTITQATFSMLRVDETGLTQIDIGILKMLYDASGPVGLDNMAICLSESSKNLSQVNEPYLIVRGLMSRSPKGRVITEAGTKYLEENGYVEPAQNNTMGRVLRRRTV